MLVKIKEIVACEKARRLAFNSLKKLEFGFLELFVGFFMFVGLVGYFGTLPADLDWIDHTVAFLMFSYFFYILNITSILFGKADKTANLIIVISYFSFFFKDIIKYTEANAFKFSVIKFVDDIYLFFSNNLASTNIVTFYIGLVGIFLLSIYLTKKIQVSHPSFLYALHKNTFKNNLAKFLSIFIILLAFYYLIFNPILEWLEFVLDDPIVLIGITYFIITIAKRHKKFHEKHLIFKIGDLVWGWYKKFISLFHYKKTLPLAVSGLLVLHALSDLGVFAYSMTFFRENFYLEHLNKGHAPFLKLFLDDVKNVAPSFAVPLFIDYFLNALSLIVFLAVPIIVWVRLFYQKGLHFGRAYLFFIYSSAAAYVLLPAYALNSLIEPSIAGADITSVSLLKSKSILDNFFPNKEAIIVAVSLISIIFGLIIYILSSNSKIKKELYAIAIIGGLTFYTVYLYYFFSSLLIYFYDNIALTIFTPHFLIGLTLAIFLTLSIMFYIGGYLMFLYEIVMEYHKRKLSEPIDEELVKVIGKIKSVERKMAKPKKAQIIGEVLKYGIVGLVSIAVLIAGYKAISMLKEKACKTEIAKFEIELKGIDKILRFGSKEMQSHDAPCKMDKIYFFDLSKKINPNFIEIPIIKDSIESGGSDNIFLVKDGNVKRSFYAGNIEMAYPYHICFVPHFDKISFFAEGSGQSVKISSVCEQPECTFIPIDISEEEAKIILKEAINIGCRNCPRDANAVNEELSNIELTKQNIEIFRKLSICDGITDVQIIIKPKEGYKAENFNFYEFIPKACIEDLRQYLAENIEGDVEIKADPLIMWHFDELTEEKKLSYRLDAQLDDSCMKLIKGLGVAKFVNQEEQRQAVEEAPKIVKFDIIIAKNREKAEIDLWRYTNYRRNKNELSYKIIQHDDDIAECKLKSNKNILECRRETDGDGTTTITLQVLLRGEVRHSIDFNVIVYPKQRS